MADVVEDQFRRAFVFGGKSFMVKYLITNGLTYFLRQILAYFTYLKSESQKMFKSTPLTTHNSQLTIHNSLFHKKNQPLQIRPFRVKQTHRVIGALREVVQYPHAASDFHGRCCDGVVKQFAVDHLGTGKGK